MKEDKSIPGKEEWAKALGWKELGKEAEGLKCRNQTTAGISEYSKTSIFIQRTPGSKKESTGVKWIHVSFWMAPLALV